LYSLSIFLKTETGLYLPGPRSSNSKVSSSVLGLYIFYFEFQGLLWLKKACKLLVCNAKYKVFNIEEIVHGKLTIDQCC
jgi:hypothetical protein